MAVEDFPGLVIQISITGRDLVEEDDNWLWVKVGAGENWHNWVEHCMGFHYWGLENLALIPGTVGAAPIQNIGAYGVELCDIFLNCRLLKSPAVWRLRLIVTPVSSVIVTVLSNNTSEISTLSLR